MHDIFIIMKFTMKDMLKRKSFIVSTIIIMLMIIIGCNIPRIMSSVNSDEKQKVLIVDNDNLLEDNYNMISEELFDISVKDIKLDKLKEKILNDEIDTGIILSKDNNELNIQYVVKNTMWMTEDENNALVKAIYSLYQYNQMQKMGLCTDDLEKINPKMNYELVQAESVDTANIPLVMVMSIILFYAIYFCAFQVSSSITTEKTSKIIETLVTSTSPTSIVIGKTIGIGLTGLLQLIVIIITTLISVTAFIEPAMVDSLIGSTNISASFILITIVYFILGYFTYALLYALTGSTVSKPEDVQYANTPIAIISVIGFYLSYFTMMNPTSNLNAIAALLPISSPFCMPFRIMMNLAGFKDIMLSLILLIITIVIIAKIAIKIYSSAILNYGSKLSFKDIIQIYKQK